MLEPLHASILVVDDDPGMRSLLQAVLTDAQATPLIARNAPEAVSILKDHAVDAVLLDLNLGDVRGEDLFDAIRKDFPELPIFPMSGCFEEEMLQRLQNRAYNGIINKPFRADSLIRSLNRAIQATRSDRFLSERV